VFNVIKITAAFEDPIPGWKTIVVSAPVIVDGKKE